jgi:hypothetical protein
MGYPAKMGRFRDLHESATKKFGKILEYSLKAFLFWALAAAVFLMLPHNPVFLGFAFVLCFVGGRNYGVAALQRFLYNSVDRPMQILRAGFE